MYYCPSIHQTRINSDISIVIPPLSLSLKYYYLASIAYPPYFWPLLMFCHCHHCTCENFIIWIVSTITTLPKFPCRCHCKFCSILTFFVAETLPMVPYTSHYCCIYPWYSIIFSRHHKHCIHHCIFTVTMSNPVSLTISLYNN